MATYVAAIFLVFYNPNYTVQQLYEILKRRDGLSAVRS